MKVSTFSFKNGQFKWPENNEIKDSRIQNAVKNVVKQFWDSNGRQQNWDVDNNFDYHVQNLDLQF